MGWGTQKSTAGKYGIQKSTGASLCCFEFVVHSIGFRRLVCLWRSATRCVPTGTAQLPFKRACKGDLVHMHLRIDPCSSFCSKSIFVTKRVMLRFDVLPDAPVTEARRVSDAGHCSISNRQRARIHSFRKNRGSFGSVRDVKTRLGVYSESPPGTRSTCDWLRPVSVQYHG